MKRFCSMALAVLMMLTVLPMSILAVGMDDSLATVNFEVVSEKSSTLAPGVELDELVLYNKNNQRVEMYVTTVDMAVDTVQVKANYKDNQNDVFGMQTLSAQVAAMEANYEEPFKIVAGINASYYNTTTGQPTGAFVMEGKDASASGDSYAFFAVLKDGTYMIGAKGEYSKYKDQMQEAIGGYQHIVHNGAVASGLDKTTLYPRQTLGLTADGKLILMTADGSQTKTVGITIQEQAEVMLALGCVEAIHLDGGNSATFGIIPEGEEEFVTKNSPSGGAERDVSNTLMIISTAAPSGTFDHAVISGEYDYYAPSSTYTFSAFGVDSTNAAAEIPETAVWTLSDDSFGTISDGRFVSSGKLGKVDIQMSDNGKVVGTKTVEIVDPTSVSFALEETTVPYGATAEIAVTALYGNFDLYTDASHYAFEVDPAAAGTMDGFKFTAAEDESVASAVVTAEYKYAEGVSDAITVRFGKGSEVLFDFEDGDVSDWRGTEEYKAWREEYNSNNPPYQLYDPDDYSNGIDKQYSEVFLASKENGGHVKSGDYALGFRMNHKNVTDIAGWLYNYLYYTGETKVLRDVENGKTAVRIGMWVHCPDLTNVAFRLVRGTGKPDGSQSLSYTYMKSDYDGATVSYNTKYAVPESGWIYIYYNLTDLDDSIVQTTSKPGSTLHGGAPNKDYYPAFLQLFTGSACDSPEDMIYYIDDITLDYSDVTEDRDAPIISDMEVCADTANFVALNGQTVDNNLLSFSAKVSDDSGNSNMTGIDYSTAKIYIDGMDMSDEKGFKASNGYIALNNVYLTNGEHHVAFVVFDKQGNETRVTKSLTVNGAADNAVVALVGRNESNSIPEAGSVYYMDIKASEASAVAEITTVLKLNTPNTFEYENIVCAPGVTVSNVSYNEKAFEVTFTLKHDGRLSGEQVLASVPVRVWAWDEAATGVTADAQFATKAIPTINIKCKTLYGEVVYADSDYKNYVCGFSGAMDVATKLDNVTAWHKHSKYLLEDKDPVCDEHGYKNRTYCDGCKSVMEWGTTIEAVGHDWARNEDGMVVCLNNGELFNGIYTDGKTYVDGVVVGDGWFEVDGVKTYYYVDGVKLTGSHMIDGVMSTFDKDGTYLPNYRYDGWFEIDDTVMFFTNNQYLTGHQMMDNQPYYFDENGMGYDGEYVIDGKTCLFDNGKFASCEDASVIEAGWCGAELHDVEYTLYADGEIRITGEGAMMNYEDVHFVTWTQHVQKFIKSVFIGKDITKVGNQAFRNCFVAKSLTFEEDSKLTSIGICAFHNMRGLTDVVLPESVSVLRQNAFSYTYNLKAVYLPAKLNTIEKNVFVKTNADLVLDVAEGSAAEDYAVKYGIDYTTRPFVDGVAAEGVCGDNATWTLYDSGKLVIGGSGAMTDFANRDVQPWAEYRNGIFSIEIGKEITHIGKYAFAYAYNVKSITFEEGSQLQSIGGVSIYYLLQLTELTLPESVTRIDNLGIAYCSKLEKVYIPQNVKLMQSKTFYNSNKIILNVAEGSYAEEFAVKYDIDYTTRPFVEGIVDSGYCGDNATWTLYESGRLVIGGSGAMTDFANRDEQLWAKYRNDIYAVEIGKEITHIGNYAFAYAYNIKSITFAENCKLESIGNVSIYYLLKLTKLDLPESVTKIGSLGIAYCSNLENVYIPQAVKSMHIKAFYNSNNVVLDVAEDSYAEQFAVKYGIDYTTRPFIEAVVAEGKCGDNATWTLYESGRLVIGGSGEMADFANKNEQPWAAYRSNIYAVEIGKDITHIGDYAFAYSYNVKSVTFEEGSALKSVGKVAVYYMLYVEEIVLPDTVEMLSSLSFGYCSRLTNVSYPATAEVHPNAFKNSPCGN